MFTNMLYLCSVHKSIIPLITRLTYNCLQNKDFIFKEYEKVSKEFHHPVRKSGSAALDLAYVAAGKVDGFWEYGLSPWDVAAGIILVKEAGGLALGIDNIENPLLTGNIVAGNVNIVKELQNILNS